MTSLCLDCYQTFLNKLDIVRGEGQRIVSVIDIDTGQSERYSDGDVMEGHSPLRATQRQANRYLKKNTPCSLSPVYNLLTMSSKPAS